MQRRLFGMSFVFNTFSKFLCMITKSTRNFDHKWKCIFMTRSSFCCHPLTSFNYSLIGCSLWASQLGGSIYSAKLLPLALGPKTLHFWHFLDLYWQILTSWTTLERAFNILRGNLRPKSPNLLISKPIRLSFKSKIEKQVCPNNGLMIHSVYISVSISSRAKPSDFNARFHPRVALA